MGAGQDFPTRLINRLGSGEGFSAHLFDMNMTPTYFLALDPSNQGVHSSLLCL